MLRGVAQFVDWLAGGRDLDCVLEDWLSLLGASDRKWLSNRGGVRVIRAPQSFPRTLWREFWHRAGTRQSDPGNRVYYLAWFVVWPYSPLPPALADLRSSWDYLPGLLETICAIGDIIFDSAALGIVQSGPGAARLRKLRILVEDAVFFVQWRYLVMQAHLQPAARLFTSPPPMFEVPIAADCSPMPRREGPPHP